MVRRGLFLSVVLFVAGSVAAQVQHVPSSIDRDSEAVSALDLLMVRHHRLPEPQMDYLSSATVSVADLSIPASARKEFEKANEFLRRQDARQALSRLGKAVAISPNFPEAYNSMGVALARLGDSAGERNALHWALALNDHFALAYVNWARMEIANAKFDDANTALRTAFSLDQSDSTALILLGYTAWKQGRLQEALADEDKAHAMGKPHAFAHRVAARVYEEQRQFDRAIAELELSLQEEPKGNLADGARHELALVRAMPR